jgi:hypothetical protein
MAFTLVTGQHDYNDNPSVSSTLVLTLPNNPTPGNLVCLGFQWADGVNLSTGITSILDSNNNSYTLTPNSPSSTEGLDGATYLAYLLSAPSNATKTVTITFARTTGQGSGFIKEFNSSVGGVTFDKDVVGTGTTGTTVNTPTLTPKTSGELFYGYAQVTGHISALAGAWVGTDTLPTTFGDADGYILSESSATAIDFTQTSGDWDSNIMAFYEAVDRAPSSGSLSLGAATALVALSLVTSGGAALGLTGATPVVNFGSSFAPSAATLALAGATPIVMFSPTTGALALASATPILAGQFAPTGGALGLGPATPVPGLGLSPSGASAALAGATPGFTLSGLTATPGVLALTPGTPTLLVTLSDGNGVLTLAGSTPRLLTGLVLFTLPGTLALGAPAGNNQAITFASRVATPSSLNTPGPVSAPPQTHTAGNLLVAVSTHQNARITGVTNTAGDTWFPSPSTPFLNADGVDTNELWYCLSTAGHANDVVTATLSGSATPIVLTVYEFSSPGAFAFVGESTGTGQGLNTTLITTGVLTITGASVIVAGYEDSNATVPTSPSGTQASAGNASRYDSYQLTAVSGAVFATTNAAFSLWGIQAAAFAASLHTAATPVLAEAWYPTAPSITLTPNAPAGSLVFTPPGATLALGAATPTLIGAGGYAPQSGTLHLTGGTAILGLALPATGTSLALAAGTPALFIGLPGIMPSGGALALSGATPLLTLTLHAFTGTLALTPAIPALVGNVIVSPTGAALALTGQSAASGLSLAPTAASLALTGATPLHQLPFLPGGASLGLVGGLPTIGVPVPPAPRSIGPGGTRRPERAVTLGRIVGDIARRLGGGFS